MNAAPTRQSVAANISLDEAAGQTWDALVVGAGPAGGMAAREIARLGANVLLVDKAAFPRWKVCGSCINGAALAALKRAGLGELTARLGARPLQRWRLSSRAGQAVCTLPIGVSLSREVFDAALVDEAIQAGAKFLDGTQATLDDSDRDERCVALTQRSHQVSVRSHVLVVADGLAGRLLDNESEFKTTTHENARLGMGALLEDDSGDFEDGTIYMACGRGGYVGLVRLEDGRLDVATALDRRAVRESGEPTIAVKKILHEAGLPIPIGLLGANWRGTPALTRRRAHAAGERVFVVGDSAGYIEPFTGEGIAWALSTGMAVAPLAVQGAKEWTPSLIERWNKTHRAIVGRRQRTCRMIGRMLKTPWLTHLSVLLISRAPWLVRPVIRAINTSGISGKQVFAQSLADR